MTPRPTPNSPLDTLQFQKAEYVDPRQKCVLCAAAIDSTYYHLAGRTICPACAEKTRTEQQRPKGRWIARGALYGAGAAAACSVVYAIITLVAGLELALISILVGFLIGRAVRIGSHGLGGRRCQIIAVALTYISITISYVPLFIKYAHDHPQAVQSGSSGVGQQKSAEVTQPKQTLNPGQLLIGFVILFGLSLFAPFLGLAQGFGGIMGLLIIFFGLSRAWQQTARDERLLMGPYTVEGSPGGV